MAFVIPNSFAAGIIVDPALTNANNTAIANKINGNMGNAEFNAGDPLALNKLAASSEIVFATMTYKGVYNNGGAAGFGWPATTALAHYPINGLSGTDSNWSVTSIAWSCGDCGDSLGTFKIDWGYFNAGAWTNVTAVLAATAIVAGGAVDTGGNALITVGMPVTLAFDASHNFSLRLSSVVPSATTCTAAPFGVTLALKRQIIA